MGNDSNRECKKLVSTCQKRLLDDIMAEGYCETSHHLLCLSTFFQNIILKETELAGHLLPGLHINLFKSPLAFPSSHYHVSIFTRNCQLLNLAVPKQVTASILDLENINCCQ